MKQIFSLMVTFVIITVTISCFCGDAAVIDNRREMSKLKRPYRHSVIEQNVTVDRVAVGFRSTGQRAGTTQKPDDIQTGYIIRFTKKKCPSGHRLVNGICRKVF